MKAREPGETPYTVFRLGGRDDRFFGKYKDPAGGAWKKVPGGPFPPEFNKQAKAFAYAARWFELELAERSLAPTPPPPAALTWPDACDRYLVAVKARVRGSDATRDEAQKPSSYLRRRPILSLKPVADHDDSLALLRVRTILSEPQARKGRENERRDPLTVRNIAKVLRDIYKFCRSERLFPRDRIIPAETDEEQIVTNGGTGSTGSVGSLTRDSTIANSAPASLRATRDPNVDAGHSDRGLNEEVSNASLHCRVEFDVWVDEPLPKHDQLYVTQIVFGGGVTQSVALPLAPTVATTSHRSASARSVSMRAIRLPTIWTT